MVTWQPPAPPNGVVTQYDIRLTASLSGAPLTVAVPANQTTHTLSVMQGAGYSVQVRARNGPLVGEYSEPVTFTATFVSMDTSTSQFLPSPAATVSSTLVEPSSSGTTPPPPASSAAPYETPPPTTTKAAPPTPSPPSPSPTPPLAGGARELSQQEVIVIAVCCALMALLLLLLVAACAGYMALRRCRDNPDKNLTYKCKSPWANRLTTQCQCKHLQTSRTI